MGYLMDALRLRRSKRCSRSCRGCRSFHGIVGKRRVLSFGFRCDFNFRSGARLGGTPSPPKRAPSISCAGQRHEWEHSIPALPTLSLAWPGDAPNGPFFINHCALYYPCRPARAGYGDKRAS
jgi:hypothetical protein